jgi:DNA repair protein RadD
MSKLVLRPYQKEAVAATVSYFRKHSSPAVIILPTGAGKSLVIAELAAIANFRVLVLTHVKELVLQNQQKFELYGLESSIFSAGLNKKNNQAKVVFASIQSAVRNLEQFKQQYSLVIIDECHRVSDDTNSQYAKVISSLQLENNKLKVLGLTATPYRLDSGWIYQYHYHGYARSDQTCFFQQCIYELPLTYMVKHKFLTPPTRYNAAVAQYDFSQLPGYAQGHCTSTALNSLLKVNQRVTQSIIEQVVELSTNRLGVMLFAATVKHAQEVLSYLPESQSAIITGETDNQQRDSIITAFKAQQLKFIVNVSVLTTGFDAPHVDVIALLRPTQSLSLFQQIVGRGLRLSENKTDCLVLDYTGSHFDIFHPEVGSCKPDSDSQPVQVFCPQCNFANIFWGKCDAQGEIIEHFGRRCQGLVESPIDQSLQSSFELAFVDSSQPPSTQDPRCQYRFKFKSCPTCNAENDIAARACATCQHLLVDPDDQLKKALQLKDAKVIRCAGISMSQHKDSLKIIYHDEHGETLSEYFNLEHTKSRKIFDDLFERRIAPQYRSKPAKTLHQIIAMSEKYVAPDFVIARKNGHFWKVVDRIFDYQGNHRKANQL